MKIHYLIGDATIPGHRPAIIFHVNNSIGGWGRGFVISLSNRYPEPEKAYREWFKTGNPQLGDHQFVQVKPDLWVANIIGQEGVRWQGKKPPIRYESLEKGLKSAYDFALENGLTVACPRLGCVLAGGQWREIEAILKKVMTVETYVYTLLDQKNRWNDPYED